MSNEFDINDILEEFRLEEAPAEKQATGHRRKMASSKEPAEARPKQPPVRKQVQAQPQREKKKKTASGKRRFTGLKITAALMVLIFAAVCGFAAWVTLNGKVFPNVYADQIELSGLNRAEALQKLADDGWTARTYSTLNVSSWQNAAVSIEPLEAGSLIDSEHAAEAALQVGRDGHIFHNLGNYLLCWLQSHDVNQRETPLNTAYITTCIDQLQAQVNAAEGELYQLNEADGVLCMVKGRGSLNLDRAGLEKAIEECLNTGVTELRWTQLEAQPACPDFTEIRAEIAREPRDARLAEGSADVLPEETGCDFDPAAAEQIWNSTEIGSEIRIPLQITRPALTAEELSGKLFHDLLGAVTTKYNNSGPDRCSNVRLATSLLNGHVILPGEEFSYNTVVGVRTEEAGFKMAPAYAGYNDIKDEIGGGVCQVSSCVYAAALFSFLEITSHTSHIYPPNYIRMGMDATVTIPADGGRSIDLKFKNNKAFPIKIVGYCEEIEDNGNGKPFRTVTIEIWGTLEDEDYMPIEFDNTYMKVYDYDRVIEPAYPDREGYVIKFTHDEWGFEDDYGKGIRTLTHRKVYDSSGKLIKDEIINPTYSEGYAMDTYYYKG
ncbi:MAG: VanW family protein [Oscillospiraceae bacterium]|nr:VanW family protein [Oscillospiraceae bacterium]